MKNKKKIITYIILAIILTSSLFVITNKYSLYKRTIIKITDVTTTQLSDKLGMNGQKEKYYSQTISAKVKNGEYKGEIVTFVNKYSYSGIKTEKYSKGDTLFVKLTLKDDNLNVTVLDVKRDFYVCLLLVLFILGLLFISNKQGICTLISVIINVTLFCFCLKYFSRNMFFSWIWIILVLIFCSLTLLFVSGFHKKTLGAILSSYVTVFIVLILYKIVIYNSETIPYEMMEYLTGPQKLSNIFMASVIIGLLGAVMDVSITINSSVNELIKTSPEISLKQLINSVREIGYDIMGTMVNVLFFAYVSSSLPLTIMKINSNYSFKVIFNFGYIFDILRFLIGSIGIVLSIPISGLISILLFKKGLKKNL